MRGVKAIHSNADPDPASQNNADLQPVILLNLHIFPFLYLNDLMRCFFREGGDEEDTK